MGLQNVPPKSHMVVSLMKSLTGKHFFKNLIWLYFPIEKWNAKAIVKGCRETGKELLSNSMANATPYLSHTSDLPSKFFWVQGESSHKHIFFSMTYSIGLIVTRSQKPSNCVCVSVCVCESLSRVRLFGTPWTVACQASLWMEFSSHEYWSGLPFSSPEDLPSPGIEPWSPADSLPFELQEVLQLSDSPLFLLLHNNKMLIYLRPHLYPHAPKKYISATKDLFRMHSA